MTTDHTGIVTQVKTSVGRLAVRAEGEGVPVVLWHSLFVDDRSFDGVVEALAGERRLIRITGPDHGTSEQVVRPFTNADCADAALQVLDALGVESPVDWVGNAWGGHVGMLAAARHPERVRSLVTLGTPVDALTPAERRRTLFLLAAYRFLGPVRFIRQGVAEVLLSERSRRAARSTTSYVEGCLRAADRAGLTNAVRAISLHREDLADALSRVVAPTLIVTSPDHKGFTPEQAEAAARPVALGECAIIDGPAYLTPFEAPEETVELLRAFWGRVDRAVA